MLDDIQEAVLIPKRLEAIKLSIDEEISHIFRLQRGKYRGRLMVRTGDATKARHMLPDAATLIETYRNGVRIFAL